jgi:predicted component of type VI protein secretion system
MKLSLLVLTPGKQEGKALEIKLPQFLVGRDPQCHLRPASPLISKRHCAVIQRDGKVFIRDFGSTNGTFLNDERVEGEQELKNGDQLKIGPIHLGVQLDATAKTPAPPTKNAVAHTPVPPTKGTAAAAKPAAPKSSTPTPATKKDEVEDDVAAMLLSLDDGESAGLTGGEPVVPEGSTVFDLKVPPEAQAAAAQGQQPAKDSKPKPSGDTRSAAANLLEKLTKRPRPTA